MGIIDNLFQKLEKDKAESMDVCEKVDAYVASIEKQLAGGTEFLDTGLSVKVQSVCAALRKEISDLQASIRAHASEVGALQILVGGGHWQVGSDKQAYLTMPSDKEVREKANSAGLINDGIKVK